MSEALLACGRCRYYWVASAPYPPYKGGALSPRRCCSTVWLPPSCSRRPLGFARPASRRVCPSRSAHTDVHTLIRTHHTVNPSATQHHSEKLFPYVRRGTVHPCSFLRAGSELLRTP